MAEKPALKILKSRYFIWPVVMLSVLNICINLYFTGIEDKVLFPDGDGFVIEGYTDASDGGNSEILKETISNSVLTFSFQLKEGFFSPYAGISISPDASDFIDATKYNQISLSLLGENIDRLGIGIYTPIQENYKIQEGDESLHHSYLTISDKKSVYNVPVNQMKHPEWWEDLHQISESEKTGPDLSRILHININSAFAPDIDKPKTLKIYSITFSRDNTKLFVILGGILFVLAFLIFISRYWRIYRNRQSEQITVLYKPVEVSEEPSKGDQTCIEYINHHFQESSLSLDLVAKETGIPQRQIAHIINEHFNCNFKTYVNRIRINEAKRLLNQTDLNIGEIAYKVGFNNQSHFNRVFKTDSPISPSEYRDNQG